MMADRKIVEALDAFSVTLPPGVPFNIQRGDRFWSDDQVVQGREKLFGELVVRVSAPGGRPTSADTETATSTPGRNRIVSRPPARSQPAAGDKGGADGGKSDA